MIAISSSKRHAGSLFGVSVPICLDTAVYPIVDRRLAEASKNFKGRAPHVRAHAVKLQRELFDNAGSMGELLTTTDLRAKVARFLHKQ